MGVHGIDDLLEAVGDVLHLQAVELGLFRVVVRGFAEVEETGIAQVAECAFDLSECFCADLTRQGSPFGSAGLLDLWPKVGRAVAQLQEGGLLNGG